MAVATASRARLGRAGRSGAGAGAGLASRPGQALRLPRDPGRRAHDWPAGPALRAGPARVEGPRGAPAPRGQDQAEIRLAIQTWLALRYLAREWDQPW
jgi:hypothetical protein